MRNVLTKHLKQSSLVVIVITVVLFVLALLSQGFTHLLFLETGVLLVSVKLLLSSYRESVFASEMKLRLDALDAAVQRIAIQMPAYLEKERLNDQPSLGKAAQAEPSIAQAQPALTRSL